MRASAGRPDVPPVNSPFGAPLKQPNLSDDDGMDADAEDAFGEHRELGFNFVSESAASEVFFPYGSKGMDRQRTNRSNSSTSTRFHRGFRQAAGEPSLPSLSHESLGILSAQSSMSLGTRTTHSFWPSQSTSEVSPVKITVNRQSKPGEVWTPLVPNNRALTHVFSSPGTDERFTWRHVAVMVLLLDLTVGAILFLFSDIGGRGFDTFHAIHRAAQHRAPVLAVLCLVALGLHALNWYTWRLALWIPAGLLILNSSMAALCLLADAYPCAPLLAASLYAPFALAGARICFARRCRACHFYAGAAAALGSAAALALAVWIAWVIRPGAFGGDDGDNWWTGESRERLHSSAHRHGVVAAYVGAPVPGAACVDRAAGGAGRPMTELEAACRKVDMVAFLVRSAPLVEALWLGWLAIFCAFVARALELLRLKRSIDRVVRGAMAALFLYGFVVWTWALLGGPAFVDADTVVLAFVCAGWVFLCIWALFSVVLEDVLKAAHGKLYLRIFEPLLVSEYFISLVFCIAGIPLLAFLALEVVCRQLERIFRIDPTGDPVFSRRGLHIVRGVADWHWGSIFENAIYWSWLFKVVIVLAVHIGAVFLSWLNMKLVEMVSFGVVACIFYVAAMVMFLIPGCPVIPVYMSAGIILVNSAKDWLGFHGGIVFAIAECAALKLNAAVVQQKLFGENLGHFMWVQKHVGVHQVWIRAIEAILTEPGLKMSKVLILCGGPDWPISVLTGILRLSLWRMLVGTLPAVLLAAPCVACGAVLLIDDGTSGLFSFTFAVLLLAQGCAMLMALYIVLSYVHTKCSELVQWRPDHERICAYAKRKECRDKLYRLCTEWANLIPAARCFLAAATALEVVTFHILFMFSAACFTGFNVSGDFYAPLEDGGLAGNAWNLFKPLSVWVLGLNAAALLLFGSYKFMVSMLIIGVQRSSRMHLAGCHSAVSLPSAVNSGVSTPRSFADERQCSNGEKPVVSFGGKLAASSIEPPLPSRRVRWKGTPPINEESNGQLFPEIQGSNQQSKRVTTNPNENL